MLGNTESNGRSVGLYTMDDMDQLATAQASATYLVNDLFAYPSVNLMVGDSGLGKTALAVSIGVAVASGTTWMGRSVRQGRALYMNGEMNPTDLRTLIASLSKHQGLAAPPSDTFQVYSPYWNPTAAAQPSLDAFDRVLASWDPQLVIVDPFRVFFAGSDMDQEKFARTLAWLRNTGKTVLLIHHRRKHDQLHGSANLVDDAPEWLQETSGLGSLVNLTDTRLGVDKAPGHDADIVLGGFVRFRGPLRPLRLRRETDEEGAPVGYSPVVGVAHLRPEFQQAFGQLPAVFRWSDMKHVTGWTSGSKLEALRCDLLDHGLVRKEHAGGAVRYRKLPGESPN